MTAQHVQEVVAAHEGWLKMRRSKGTVTKYTQHLRPFAEWVGERPLGSVTAVEIEFGFLAPYAEASAVPTVRNRIAALRSLYEFAERFDLVEKNPMRKIESPARDDRMGGWLRDEDDLRMLEACQGPMETIIVSLLRYTGLRVSEATNLKWQDIDFGGARLTVTKSKTASGRRTIPLHPLLVPQLRAWGGRSTGEFVLGTRQGTPMKPQFVWRVVRRVGDRAGIPGFTRTH